ncbi:MAG: helix-turn-helix domain-containing protein [Marmoricola sp.]
MTQTAEPMMTDTDIRDGGAPEGGTEPHPEVRRNLGLSACLGLAASVMAVAFLDRASDSGSVVDWLICGAMTVVAVVQLAALVDGRTPLLVADAQGVRVRLGGEWLGLPWAVLEQVVVEEREGLLRDGRVVLTPRNLDAALEAVDKRSRRHAGWHRKLYGAPLTVPLSLGTRVNTGELPAQLRRLADGRTEVVAMRGRERAQLEPVTRHGRGDIGRLVSRFGGGGRDLDADPLEPPEDEAAEAPVVDLPLRLAPPVTLAAPVPATRAARPVRRTEVVREQPPRFLLPVSEPDEPDEPETAEAPEEQAEPPAPVRVFDDVAPASVGEPVIGPEIRAARERAGLSIDELSDRTVIRPHVLEAIEVDDFAPCGGDFYARGHLHTLSRYLGLDQEQLFALYDEHYSHGPINARRVFEAELATGITGGMRGTFSGPRWSLLAAAVLSLLMLWGIARFFTDQPAQVTSPTPAVSDSAGLAASHEPAASSMGRPRHLTISAEGARTHVVVRDRTGTVVWSGVVEKGRHHQVVGRAPFQVRSTDGKAAYLAIGNRALGTVGDGHGQASRRVG